MRKILIMFMVLTSCVDPYDYRSDSLEQMLVVEGYVSDEPGNSRIRLSMSGDFEQDHYAGISGAVVTVLENVVAEHPFEEISEGEYGPVDTDFYAIFGNSYELRVKYGGREYFSSQVYLQPALEIDSITVVSSSIYESGSLEEYKVKSLLITSNSNPEASKYYRYSMTETWLSVAQYSQNLRFKPEFVMQQDTVYRYLIDPLTGEPFDSVILAYGLLPVDVHWDVDTFENIRYCWKNAFQEGLVTATSEGFTENRLVQIPIYNVPLESDRLLYKYSALIRQYSIDKQTHFFLEKMKEFSQSEGGLYDIQPGFVDGNIQLTDDETTSVIGIFYASSVNTRRVYISHREDFTNEEQQITMEYAPICEYRSHVIALADSIPDNQRTMDLIYLKDSILSLSALYIFMVRGEGPPPAELAELSSPGCVDCRLQGGTNVKPTWWEESY